MALSLALADVERVSPVAVRTYGEDTVTWWSLSDPLDIGHMPGSVFTSASESIPWRSGSRLQYRPDWYCLTPAEARRIGVAFLAAARAAGLDEHGVARLHAAPPDTEG